MLILVLNSGSSSLKVAVIDPESGETHYTALVERLGTSEATHEGALAKVLQELKAQDSLWSQLAGVGHRVVHGGELFSASCLIDQKVCARIEECATLAPLHNPANLLGIIAARQGLPHLPHVAVFDTAFHLTMPEHAYRYAIPESWYTDHRIRRYGFHGTSHRYVTREAANILGREPENLNLVTAHLGNGCSLAAVAQGKCVDTTMGLTPLEGLVMGTRSGDIDPAIFRHLVENAGLTLAEVDRALNRESGLLGLSGTSNDMRQLCELAPHDPRAKLAIDVFCHRLAKYIGALCTSFPVLDALVFTGGIGEHSARVRSQVCARLGTLGIAVDAILNESHARRIETPESRAAVLVVPTNEELLIARDTFQFVAM